MNVHFQPRLFKAVYNMKVIVRHTLPRTIIIGKAYEYTEE